MSTCLTMKYILNTEIEIGKITGVCTSEYRTIFYRSYLLSQVFIMDNYCFLV